MLLDKPINSWIEKLPHWLLVASFAFPALPLNVSNVLFISFSVFVILFWVFIKPIVIWKQLGSSLVLSIPMFPYLIEYCFHLNSGIMSFELGKKLLFFLAPVSIPVFVHVFKPSSLRPYFNAFVASLALLSAFALTSLVAHGDVINPASYTNGAFLLRTAFENVTHLHPTYFGFFSAIAIFWIITDYKNYPEKLKYAYFLFAFLLLVTMVLVAAKMPLFILMAGSMWLFYKEVKAKKRLATLYGAMTLFTLLVVNTVPSMKSRMNEVTSYMSNTDAAVNTINQRELIFDCSKDVFMNNMWRGTGARQAQLTLDNCYKSKSGSAALESYKYNSHNQYLTLGISYGIFMLLIFIASLLYAITRMKQFTFGIVMALSTCCIMLSESILERQMGIYFFLLFWLIAMHHKTLQKKSY